MPWCPNCKMEYVAGKTTCIDCGAELIDDMSAELELITFMTTEKEKLAHKFVQFLHYSKIDNATYEYNEETELWHVLVNETAVKQVKKLYEAFYSVETQQQLSDLMQGKESIKSSVQGEDKEEYTNSDNEFSNDELSKELSEEYLDEDSYADNDSMFDQEELVEVLQNSKKKPSKPTTYVKKEEQYKDLKSSAFTFLIVAVLGIAVLILNAVGIIHLFYGIMPYIVMGIMFIAFIVVGFSSYSSAKKVETEIEEENRVTDAINHWLSKNITADLLNSYTNSEDAEEIKFFHKLEKMKEMINAQFGELDESYLDRLVEEFYNGNIEVN